MHILFIYGTLKHGHRNAALLKHAEFLGSAITNDAAYTMVAVNDPACDYAYPGVILGGSGKIVGELYRIDAATLAVIDRLEAQGVDYNRQFITITDSTNNTIDAMIYLFINAQNSPVMTTHPHILRGMRDGDNFYEWVTLDNQPV